MPTPSEETKVAEPTESALQNPVQHTAVSARIEPERIQKPSQFR